MRRDRLVLLALLAACRSKEPPPVTAAPVAVASPVAVTPRGTVPAQPGRASLGVTGAVTRDSAAAAIECARGEVHLTPGPADTTRPPWTLDLIRLDTGAWGAVFALRPDGAAPIFYRWAGAAPPALNATPFAAAIALTLTGEGGARVQVAAELVCPVAAYTPVPPDVTAILARHAGAVRAYATHDLGRQRDLGAVSAILAVDHVAAEATLRRVRADLPAGWVAYLGTEHFLGAERHPAGSIELSVARGNGPLDIVRAARTDSRVEDLETEQIVQRLAAWDRAWGIDVIHAQTDTIELALGRMPGDIAAFTREVYALSPDAVTQQAGSLAALQQEIAARRRVYLRWD